MSDDLEMSVKVWYLPHKSQRFSNWHLGLETLREDLTSLKLPHPKAENVKFYPLANNSISCQFTWPNTRRGSVSLVFSFFSPYDVSRFISIRQVLYRHLKSRICPDDDERREAFKEAISSLSMCVFVIALIPDWHLKCTTHFCRSNITLQEMRYVEIPSRPGIDAHFL